MRNSSTGNGAANRSRDRETSEGMKVGTQIRMADGREATVVFHGLVGDGIKWGLHEPRPEDFEGTSGDLLSPADDSPALTEDWPWHPDAYLRSPFPSADLPCVGDDFEVVT